MKNKKINQAIVFFLLIAVFVGCKSDEPKTEEIISVPIKIDETAFSKALEARLKQADDTLFTFYSNRNFKPIWVTKLASSATVYTALAYLKKTDEHGLKPYSYNYSSVFGLVKYIHSSFLKGKTPAPDSLAAAEYLLSAALTNYAHNMRFGVVDPSQDDPNYTLPLKEKGKYNLFEILNTTAAVDYLQKIQPQSERYTKLQKALKQYKKLSENGGWNKIVLPAGVKKIEPGDSAAALEAVAERLVITGELSGKDVEKSINREYDSLNPLFNAVKAFQVRHGLNPDAVIGGNTLERMNLTAEECVEQIKINLERFRWFDYEKERYILVNIPDFRFFAVEKGEIKETIKVCVGINGRWQTPTMYGEFTHLILNPTWNVPPSIAKDETYRKAKKNPSYLRRAGFNVYRSGKKVNPDSINWDNYSASNLPFRFAQSPGAGNALGKVKFMFDNPFSVYLHDTPTRPPFQRDYRAVSHGCVRVEKPLQFAEYLAGDTDMTFEEIERALSTERGKYSGKKVLLKNKVPLFIDYFTAWVDKAGQVHFRADVYGKDKIIREALGAHI